MRLRELRRKRGWSQVELAARSGVSQPTISEVERGTATTTATLDRLADALGCSIGELYDQSYVAVEPDPASALVDLFGAGVGVGLRLRASGRPLSDVGSTLPEAAAFLAGVRAGYEE